MASSSNDASDETPASSKPENPLNDREKDLFMTAMMYCVKGGRPTIDYEKFREFGGFNTLKTAQNTWAKIKGKLPEIGNVDEGTEGAAPAKKTPKSAKSTPKKRIKAEEGETETEESLTKKKKTPAKKVVAAGADVVKSIEKEEAGEEE